MLLKAKTLKGYSLNSLDGEIGKVEEFYFDDRHWTIRYLIANTGSWLTDRQVLISPYALGAVDEKAREIDVALTRKKIEESPALTSDKPVSRQFEDNYYGYYGWPGYWSGQYSWGCYPYLGRDQDKWLRPAREERVWDPHLRSTRDVSGHDLQASDGEIGHVEDFIIDDETWAIRYFIINTRNWWPGKKVLISPQWIERVSWSESKVFVNLTREAIKRSPEYTEGLLPTRDFETKLHHHYNRQGYWVEEQAVGRPRPIHQ
jgi:uncharacterized protein YrrD